MIITHQGIGSFKIQFGDTALAVNPVSKNSQHKASRFGADIALISLNHPDYNGADNVSHGDREPFAVSGPGEYEIKGVLIKGFPSVSNYGGEERINTIYRFILEGMTLCFLGALSSTEFESSIRESLDSIDVLFVPIGGDGVLSARDAYKLAVSLEPKIIIPCHYDTVGEKDALKTFMKEEGEAVKPVEKLTLKRKDLDDKEGEIVVLKPSA